MKFFKRNTVQQVIYFEDMQYCFLYITIIQHKLESAMTIIFLTGS